MVQFFIDKNNKVPLYLQLKDQIKYFISTGAITAEEKLPPVKILAKTLGINFLTVRKAYKELEESGLINIRHGEGCFISLTNNSNHRDKDINKAVSLPTAIQNQFAEAARQLLEQFLQQGLILSEIKKILDDTFSEVEKSKIAPIIVFVECNNFQINQISKILEDEIKLIVKPLLVKELSREIPILMASGRKINIVTTGFHVNEVRQAVGELAIQIDVLITNLNPETRRQLEQFGEKASYSFICRDKESAVLYKELLKAELGYDQLNLTSCTLSESEKVQKILETAEVILTSPPVYEEVKKMASPKKPVFNLFERVDPMSLKVFRDRILGVGKSPP